MPPDLLPPAVLPALLAGGGLAVVLVAALLFRLHALIALTLAGLAVMWLTPRAFVVRAEVETTAERFRVRGVGEESRGAWTLQPDGVFEANPESGLTAFRPGLGGGLGGSVASLSRRPIGRSDWKFPVAVDGTTLVRTDRGDFEIDEPSLRYEDLFGGRPPSPVPSLSNPDRTPGLLRPGDLLVAPDDLAAAEAVAALDPPARLAAAFGRTAADIGLLIALASVLGAGLTHSGAAERLVRTLLSVVGPRGHPAAFCAGGLALGVPVFFDAVFLLCAPLAKSTALKTGGNYTLLLLAVCCGGALTHSLVPPTPGPLLVAAELGVPVPRMIAAGLAVSAAAAPVGLLWAWWWCRRRAKQGTDVPVRDGAGAPLDRLRELAERPAHELPPLWASVAPLAVPVFLIAQRAAWDAAADRLAGPGWEVPTKIAFHLGEPTTAVLLGTLLALWLLWRWSGPGERREVTAGAVAEGGGILLVAAAGGAFGAALRQTGVGGLVAAIPDLGGFGLLVTAWAVAAAVRTAQGSATVAMVVAAGVVGAAVPGCGVDAVWVACAIGCGSKAVAWMNSSGFWVVSRAGGLTEREALATFTPLTAVLSLAGLAATLAGAVGLAGGLTRRPAVRRMRRHPSHRPRDARRWPGPTRTKPTAAACR